MALLAGIAFVGGFVTAHAGHPADWLPFVAPFVLVGLAWLVIRAVRLVSPDEAEEHRDDRMEEADAPQAEALGDRDGSPE